MKIVNILKFTLLAVAITFSASIASHFVSEAVTQTSDFTSTAAPIGASLFVVFAGLFILKAIAPSRGRVAMTSLDITELTTVLGAYSRKSKAELISKMVLGMDIDDRMETWDDCKDEVALPGLTIEDIVKPANATTFSPTANALGFGARILKVRAWKVDLQIVPQDLEKSWLGGFKKKGSDAFDLPFEQYIMNHIIAKVQENIRMKALFAGIYNAVGTTPGAVMDGLKTLIAAEITATNITPVATGAVSLATIIDDVETTFDGLDEAYKNMETQCLLSPTLFDYYTRKYRTLYGANANYDGMPIGSVRLDGTNCIIKREPGLGTSQRIIVTPKANIVYGTDSLADINNIEVQKFDRTLKLLIDAKSGIQFKEVGTAIAVNDVA